MKKILILVIVVGLFYGCASREESIIESYKELYNNGTKTVRTLDGTVSVNLKNFFSLSKEEQLEKIKETEKDLARYEKEIWGKRGIEYNESASDEEKSRQITLQILEQGTKNMPPKIRERILNAKREQYGIGKKDNSIEKIKKLLRSIIPDYEKIKYELKVNSLALSLYSDVIGESFDEVEEASNESIIKIEKIIKKKNFDINQITSYSNKETLIFNAIKKGNLQLVKILVENGAKLNLQNKGNTFYPKYYRYIDDYTSTIDLTPIVLASTMGYKHIVDYLIDQDVNLTIGEPLITHIVRFNDLKLIDKCLKKGLNINSINWLGNTPLIVAIGSNAKLKTIKYLIDKGANIYATPNHYYYTKFFSHGLYYYPNILSLAKGKNSNDVYDFLKSIYNPILAQKSKQFNKNPNLLNNERSKILQKIDNQQGSTCISKIDISNDEKLIAFIDYFQVVRVFNFINGELIKKFKGKAYGKIFKFIDNQKIVIASNKNIFIWDFKNAKVIKNFSEQSIDNDIPIKDIKITPNKRNILVLKTSGNINIWNIKKGKVIKVIEKNAIALAVLDNNRIVYGAKDNSINLLNINTEQITKLGKNKKSIEKIYKRSNYILVENSSEYLQIFNIDTMKEQTGFKIPYTIDNISVINNKIVFSGVIDRSERLYIWDLSTSKKIDILGYHRSNINDLILLPKSKRILSVDCTQMKVWNLQ